MTTDPYSIVISEPDDGNLLSLPVDREKLSSFISGLLGQPQSIEGEMHGIFNIDHEWLLHIHALLDQRIRQNHSTLTAFKGSIFFKNGKKRTLETLDSFLHYSETKKMTSVAVRLTWTYLINFPDKSIPEKQEITFYAAATPPQAAGPMDPIRWLLSTRSEPGVISYKIHHTERSWGDDIDTILGQQVELAMEKPNRFTSLLSTSLFFLTFVLFLAGAMLPEGMNTLIQERHIEAVFSTYSVQAQIPTTDLASVGEKLDLALKALDPRNSANQVGFLYRVVSLLLTGLLAMWCFYLSGKGKPSYVVLSKETEKLRDKELSAVRRNYLLATFSFLASIAAGVIGNYVYLALSS
ncbi:hypothetical protein [Pseudomonas crudilactis]|uniref:hypothetical protein n=1 Tax=Pseudomonas crudilactis TaxID=2697028 RepID=UPI0002EC9459|nr:hypothetical protein [Pseudomonas crudilactis]